MKTYSTPKPGDATGLPVTRRDERHEPPDDDWRNLVDWCRARGERLSEREANFLAGMCDWIGEPSAKQVASLEAIANKLRRAR
jgi:hypothetical protein